jgi:hypothetical protein
VLVYLKHEGIKGMNKKQAEREEKRKEVNFA